MNEIVQDKGFVNVAEDKIHVTGLKGPLEKGWRQKVQAFVSRIPAALKVSMARGGARAETWRAAGAAQA